jgi:serine protease Do
VEGLGFAIPMDDVLSMIKDIMENGQVTSKAYMGVSVADVTRYPQTGVRSGAYLVEVVEDGPAAKAGLQAGDVVTMLGTTTITSQSDLTDALGSKSYQAGDTATVTYIRDGQVYTTDLTFGSTTEKPDTDDTTATQDSSQGDTSNGYYYYGDDDMEDFFEQFFGGTYGGRG